jgi:hypothetical protein
MYIGGGLMKGGILNAEGLRSKVGNKALFPDLCELWDLSVRWKGVLENFLVPLRKHMIIPNFM